MLINAADPEESRIAVVENGVLQELHVELASREAYLGNIYKGKVVNVEPSIGAAFVSFGGRMNGFLHASDVLPAYARDDFRLSDIMEGRARVTGEDGPDVVRSVLEDEEEEDDSDSDGDEPVHDEPAPAAEPQLEVVEEDEFGAIEEVEPEAPPVTLDSASELPLEAEAERGAPDAPAEPTESSATSDDPPAKPKRKRGGRGRRRTAAPDAADGGNEEAPPAERGRDAGDASRDSGDSGDADYEPRSPRMAAAPGDPDDEEAQEPGDGRPVAIEPVGQPAQPHEEPAREGRRNRGRGRDRGRERQAKPRLPIDQLLRRGQEVVVQVTKEGIGAKGPTLTTYISLPGRYLVLMPSLPKCGVSRKIGDLRERKRLKKIVRELDETGNGGIGFIVRTAGIDKAQLDLVRDRDYLKKIWELISHRLEITRAPSLLYQESDLVLKAMRDLFTPDIEEVVVDNRDVYLRIKDFAEKLMPRMAERIRLHESTTPLFHSFGIEKDIETLYQPRVELSNGGSIVIEQTEALVAIDVNSGRFKPGSDLDETAYRTNLEAIPEIVRQLRLRDLGGVIIIDFIDMSQERHRRGVERRLVERLRGDRARIKVGRVSAFGMLELTRQRVGPGLKHTVFSACPSCQATGLVRTVQSKALAVLREVRALLHLKGFSILTVYLSPSVNDFLVNYKRRELLDLEDQIGKTVVFKAEPRYPVDTVHYRFQTGDGQEARVAIPAGLGVKA